MISHNKPTVGAQEMSAVENVLKSGQLSQSREVKKFEEDPLNFFLNFVSNGYDKDGYNGKGWIYQSLFSGLEGNRQVCDSGYSCWA